MDLIQDIPNYIRSRRKKGKSSSQIRDDLINHGYDYHAASALILIYLEETTPEE